MKVKILKLRPDAILPRYAHGALEDAGLDLYAVEDVTLHPNVPGVVQTGIALGIPIGYEGQIRSRSGLALNRGVIVLNSPGTVDPGYRGEIGVILLWTGYVRTNYLTINQVPEDGVLLIKAGERVAQLVIAPYAGVVFEEVADHMGLGGTERGTEGFGSTG